MTNQEYTDYMQTVYDYLTSKTQYVGTRGEVLDSFFGTSPTYEFFYSYCLADHYIEKSNSYDFVAAFSMKEDTKNLNDDISIDYYFDESNEYSVKRVITYNNKFISYKVNTFFEDLETISTKEEFSSVLSNYLSYSTEFDKSFYYDYFKYEMEYSSYYVNVIEDGTDQFISYTYNAIPWSTTYVIGNGYTYQNFNNVSHGVCYGDEETYYYIEYENRFTYCDYQELTSYSSFTQYQNQFTEYEDNMEKVLTYEDNTKTIYTKRESMNYEYMIKNKVDDLLSMFKALYIDNTEQEKFEVSKKDDKILFSIEETIPNEIGRDVVDTEGYLDVVTCQFKYVLNETRYVYDEEFSVSSCNVSLTFIDANEKVEIDKTKNYTIYND